MDARPEIIRHLRGQLSAIGGGASATKRDASTHLALLDAFASANEGGLASGAIHEVLADTDGGASVDAFALRLASAVAASREGGWVVWSDPDRSLYPPALAQSGVALERLLILRPKSPQEALWALTECMRCSGVAATVAQVGKLTPVQARRLQLAVEQGGGVGVLVRPDDRRATNYAAATRWRLEALASDAGSRSQKWQVELAYGHGGRVGQRFILEVDRETRRARAVSGETRKVAARAADNSLHRAADLAIRPRAATTARRSSA